MKKTLTVEAVLILAVTGLSAWQERVAPNWQRHAGIAAREVTVLLLVFGLLDRYLDQGLTTRYASRIILASVAIFAGGNILDGYFGASR